MFFVPGTAVSALIDIKTVEYPMNRLLYCTNYAVMTDSLMQVIKKKAWRNVAKELNLPASITSAAFTMRSQ